LEDLGIDGRIILKLTSGNLLRASNGFKCLRRGTGVGLF
jgi:hypothetical protein